MPDFQRPESLHFPTVYRTFSSSTESEIKFRVQDLPEELFDEAIELFVKHFITEETLSVSKKLAENDEAVGVIRMFFHEAFQERLSIGCFNENTDELAGVNIMMVKSKDDKNPQVRF